MTMLEHSFIHLPGIGPATELSLWERGICTWESFHRLNGWERMPFSQRKCETYREILQTCRERLWAFDPGYFARSLGPKHLWRLFADFREYTAFLDIETTGLGGPFDHITTIALYDGRELFHYIHGDNLDLFAGDIQKYKLLVTYNGTCFDLPFIRNALGIAIDHVHIDLRYLLGSLGYKGGLKGCEKRLGLDRGELEGVDGWFAVLLWREYRNSGNLKALETLLAYNMADAANLENLAVQAFNMKVSETPFEELKIPLPHPPAIPFKPDLDVINELRRRYYQFSE